LFQVMAVSVLGTVIILHAVLVTAAIGHEARQLPPMIAYWSGYELGNRLDSLKNQPFGIVMLTMGFFYSDSYAKDTYNVCGWSLNVAVKECSSNQSLGTNCGSKSFVEPPPSCCTKDITQASSSQCPGKSNCDLQCKSCQYAPEPADCCFTPSGIDTRYLTLRHQLNDIRSGIKVLQAAGKKVMISMFDRMNYMSAMSPTVTLAQIDTSRAASNLAGFIRDMGLDGVDFNFENIACSHSSGCQWVDIVRKTRHLMPEALISVTSYAGAGDALGVLHQVQDVIDFAQEDSYGGATSFFSEMQKIVGNRRVYYGIEADGPRTSLASVPGLAANWNASGAAGLFLWVANRDTRVSTSCLDPVHGDHPVDWAYTSSMWKAMFPSLVETFI